jgi:hypothetical protein
MAGASEENENHWPGYVDALTTMTMMLIFVMMILSVAMFTMSENVSRGLVEKIAESAGVNVTEADLTTEDLARKVSEKIEEKTSRAIARAEQGLPGEERRIASTAEPLARKTDAPVTSERSPALLTLVFRPRAIALDEQSQNEMKAFLESRGETPGESRFELKAYANAEAGGLSDSRRVAYYRAMTIRTHLIGLGVDAHRISVRVEDRPLADQAEKVQLFAR